MELFEESCKTSCEQRTIESFLWIATDQGAWESWIRLHSVDGRGGGDEEDEVKIRERISCYIDSIQRITHTSSLEIF